MTSPNWDGTITVIGAGLAGVACARELQRHDVPVRLYERGKAPGGRLAAPEWQGRRVDIGAAYFTVRDPEFAAVVEGWHESGRARPWTDTLAVLSPDRPPEPRPGPMRWATPAGLRSLVRAELGELEVELDTELTELPDGPVVLAMPDPQAARLVELPDPVEYAPVIVAVLELPERSWPFADGAFIHDVPELSLVVDDGARRGDDAPVLVLHSGHSLARAHLDDPAAALPSMLTALRRLFDVPEPVWTRVHRWSFAQPAEQHRSSFGLVHRPGLGPVGLAGDQWCPTGSPRVESAWRSGTDLARAIVAARG